MPRKLAATLLLSLALLLLTGLFFNPSYAQTSPSLPPVNPALKAHFILGLGNQPDKLGWMQASGAAWDARYQYLVGGVNTGVGWPTYNTPTGQFATFYMEDSQRAGYMPIFTYYQLLQSLPHSGNDENERVFNNVNNPQTMAAYYDDFKLLLDKARAFNRPVIAHIEPDFWGFMELRSGNPNSLTASVASSGHPDMAGLPNTIAGFAQSFVRLRDRYAPNVILAYHVSPWSSGVGDVSSNRETTMDVGQAALQTANFYLQANANFDLLFYDVADRDAALHAAQGRPQYTWDANNIGLPNFNRFHQFVAGITAATNKRGMLWQVPVGNTIYRTVNNTRHHWQDNRVQYYLNDSGNAHIQELANSGIIGILFGAGAGENTSSYDSNGDGVTNPAPINGNNLLSNVSDDDGGYLRLQAAAYYQRGVVGLPDLLPRTPSGLSATAPTSTQLNLTWADNSNSELGFVLEVKSGTVDTWQEISTLTAGSTNFLISNLPHGTPYSFRIKAYNSFGTSTYSNEYNLTTIFPVPSEIQSVASSDTQININWQDNSNSEVGFAFEYKIGTNDWLLGAMLGAGANSFSLNNLAHGTPYSFRVKAYNTYGASAYSSETTTTTPFPVPLLSGNVIASDRFNLTWQDKANSTLGFKIERSLSETSGWSQINTIGVGGNNVVDANREPDTLYYYRIRAFNNYNDSDYSRLLIIIMPPKEPTNLVARTIGIDRAELNWSDNSNGEQGFVLERKNAFGGVWVTLLWTISPNSTVYVDSGRVPGAIYYYRLRAYNGLRISAYSNEASAAIADTLIVTSITDDGTGMPGSLSKAISDSVSSRFKTISFALESGNTVTVTGSIPPIPADVTIAGACGLNGPTINIQGIGNATGLKLNGKVNLYGLRIAGFAGKQIESTLGPNRMICIATSAR